MESGAITNYFDVAQVTLYVFWVFFLGLVLYLRREDKREGYPLVSDRSPYVRVEGYPATPEPKVFKLAHGGTYEAPNNRPEAIEKIQAEPVWNFPGAPLQPTGDPMKDAVGPAAYANRSDEPDLTIDGDLKVVPLRVAEPVFYLDARDPDPRGFTVVAADDKSAGTICDVWVDRSEPQVRYLEVEVAADKRRVLLPIGLAKVHGGKRQVRVKSILSHHFVDVPMQRNPDQVTLLEEDKICAYYAGGTLYATPERQEPLI